MTTTTWAPPSEFRAQCLDLYGLTCPPLWGPPRRPDFPTLGGKAARVMEELGTPPMPHQRYTLDVALEIDPVTGLFGYREVGLSIPRQQGKTAEVLAVMVHRIRAWARQNVVYAAQTRGMARTRWEDEFLVAMDSSKLVGKYRTRKSNGNEAIIWSKTRSKLGITSNTEKAGHGPPLDLGAIDEAFAHEDDRLEQAFKPAMATKEMAQLWWASAGGTEKSKWLNKKRERGRELMEALWLTGTHPGVAYFEWFAPPELNRNDPATWYGCMPALCPSESRCECDPAGKWRHTITVATIRADKDGMDEAEFDRAYLNRTRKAVPPPDPNVPSKEWPTRVDERSRPGKDIAIAVDITPLRLSATIVIYGPRHGLGPELGHVEVIDGPGREGIDWVVARLAQLKARYTPVAIALDSFGPAGTLLTDLDKAGIRLPKDPARPRRGDLAIASTRDVTGACGQFADAVRQGSLRHIDQLQLNVALAGARSRPLGDAWAWARKAADVDISPLVAASLARWAYEIRAHVVDKQRIPLVAVASKEANRG